MLLGLDVLYRRRLASRLIDRVPDDAVFTTLENLLALKLFIPSPTIRFAERAEGRFYLRFITYV